MGKRSRKARAAETRLGKAERELAELQYKLESLRALAHRPTAKLLLAYSEADARVKRLRLIEQYGGRQGTPETYANLAGVRQSALLRMQANGTLSDDQLDAAFQIASVCEAIERAVSVRGASFMAPVDGSGSGRDILVESLGRVRLEVLYSAWRNRLRAPRRLVIDLVVEERPLKETAAQFRVDWRTARRRLIDALDLWNELRQDRRFQIDDDDVKTVYARLGCGVLLPPRLRKPLGDGEEGNGQ